MDRETGIGMTSEELAELLCSVYESPSFSTVIHEWRNELSVAVIDILKQRINSVMLRNAQSALKIAEVAGVVASEVAAPEGYALANWGKGNALHYLSHYTEALACYQKAAQYYEARGDLLTLVRLKINQVAVLKELDRYPEALSLIDHVRPICEALGEPAWRYLAGLEMNQGTLAWQWGDLEDALAAYQRGVVLAEKLNEPILVARFKINQANAWEGMDHFSEAEALLFQARDTLGQAGQDQELARANLNLGRLAYRRGQYLAALQYLDVARTGFAAIPNWIDMAITDLRRAWVYSALNLHLETITLARDAIPVFRKEKMAWLQAAALWVQGLGYERLNARDKADQLFLQAQRIFQAHKAQRWSLEVDGARIRLALAAGHRALVERLARKIVERGGESPHPQIICQAYLGLAQCALAGDNFDDSLIYGYLGTVREMAERFELREVMLETHYLFSLYWELKGDKDRAWESVQAALTLLDSLRSVLAVEEFYRGYLDDKGKLFERAITLAGQRQDWPGVLRNLEGLAGTRFISPRLITVQTESESASALSQIWKLREVWHNLQAQLEILGKAEDGKGRSVNEAQLLERLGKVETELVELTRRYQIETAGSDFQAVKQESPAPWVEQIRSKLSSQELLLQYYFSEGRVQALLVTSESVISIPDLMEGGELDRWLRGWRFSVNQPPWQPPMFALRQLYQTLLAPLDFWMQGRQRLFVVLPAVWYDLPLAAAYDGQRYLVERMDLVRLAAVGDLLEIKDREDDQIKTAVVVGYSDGGRLAGAVSEAQQVASSLKTGGWRVNLLREEFAAISEVRLSLKSAGLLHIATHALFRDDNPFFSWLRLADGRLTVAELYEMQLSNRPLVVLSACESGKGQPRGGGLLGLSRGFIAAGAAGVVSGLWLLDDAATSDFVDGLYGNLKEVSPLGMAHALSQAQRQFIEQGQPVWRWAGFTVIAG